jgi:hypothetical protein
LNSSVGRGGMFCVLVSYYINNFLLNIAMLYQPEILVDVIPPLTEEFLKAVIILILIKQNKIGFLIDGAIYGFAVGAGFALIENTYYLYHLQDANIMLWLVRGFGTAIMHGGTVAIFSVLIISAINRDKKIPLYLIMGYLLAVSVHYFYNRVSNSAQIATFSIILSVPTFLFLILDFSQKSIRNWVDLEMDKEVELLLMIRQGQFSNTKSGQYIISLKKHFQPIIMVDVLSYIYIYLELSIKAKANLILKENNIPVIKIHDIEDQLHELKVLKKNIGKTGMIAISPILRMNNKDLWNLSTLK